MRAPDKTDRPNLVSYLREFTPDQCREYLKNMMHQRTTNERKISLFTADMGAEPSRWLPNGEAIQHCVNGKWMNGQHRFLACIRANKPFWSIVVEGVPEEAMPTIDTGMARTAGNVLAMNGFQYYNTIAAAANWLSSLRPGHPLARSSMTNAQILEWARANEDAVVHAAKAYGAPNGLIPGGLAVALFLIFKKVDAEAATTFMDDLKTGENLGGDDPVHVLRERLMRDVREKTKLVREDIPTLVIRAWNHRRRFEYVKFLKASYTREFDGKMRRTIPEVE